MFNHDAVPFIPEEGTYEDLIPGRTLAALDRWGNEGIYPGSFTRAVLRNDLMGAVMQADTWNLVALPAITRYVYNQLPSRCHGGREEMAEWAEERDAEGPITDPEVLEYATR